MKKITFAGYSKRDSIRKAINYYCKHDCEISTEKFISKCRLQRDKITICYYPDMIIDLYKYREYVRKIDIEGKYEEKAVIGRRWGIGFFLQWFRDLFK